MKDLNLVVLIGRLTDNPELKYTKNNKSYVNFSIANNQGKDKSGQEYPASFFNCTAWGVVAENIAKYLVKGSLGLFKGELKQDQWTDDNGLKRSTVKIIVFETRLMDNKKPDNVTDESHVQNSPDPDFDIPF